MGKLFASLYLYILVSLFLASGVIEKFWPYEEGKQELILGEDVGLLLSALAQSPQGLEEIRSRYAHSLLPRVDIVLPPDLQAQLDANQAIYLFDEEHRPLWYLPLDEQTLLRVGPIADVARDTSFWPYLIVLTLLGAPVGLWSFLIWRDFLKLRHACERLEAQPESDISTTSQSIFLPIADTLNAMQRRIKGLLSAQRELTSSVSHEFRTPLARLKFAIAMLEGDVPEQKRSLYLANMHADVSELEGLVSEMLQYARLDRERPDLHMAHTDLGRLVEGVVAKLSFDSHIIIHTQIKGPVNCFCDAHFVARSIQNLLDNARKYARSEITLTLSEKEQYCIVDVCDDGPGIDPDEWESVFKPFTRLDQSRDKRTGGYGLGLAIVAKIVGWHGGYCEVGESKKGGARVSLYLPQGKTRV